MSLQLGAVGRGERKDLRYLIKIGVRVPCRATPCATHKNATLIWIGSGFRAPGASPSAGLGFAERMLLVGSYVTEDVRCCIDRADARSRSDRTARRV